VPRNEAGLVQCIGEQPDQRGLLLQGPEACSHLEARATKNFPRPRNCCFDSPVHHCSFPQISAYHYPALHTRWHPNHSHEQLSELRNKRSLLQLYQSVASSPHQRADQLCRDQPELLLPPSSSRLEVSRPSTLLATRSRCLVGGPDVCRR